MIRNGSLPLGEGNTFMEQDVLHSLSCDIEIQQASNHLLILCLVLFCFLLEEVYAPPTQPRFTGAFTHPVVPAPGGRFRLQCRLHRGEGT
jgi:hypothetical protein